MKLRALRCFLWTLLFLMPHAKSMQEDIQAKIKDFAQTQELGNKTANLEILRKYVVPSVNSNISKELGWSVNIPDFTSF